MNHDNKTLLSLCAFLISQQTHVDEAAPDEAAQHEVSAFLDQLTERRMSDQVGGTEAELLTAELDVYRMFVDAHCKSRGPCSYSIPQNELNTSQNE